MNNPTLKDLASALSAFPKSPTNKASAERLDTLLDTLFASATASGRRGLLALQALLEEHSNRIPPAQVWLALTNLSLARGTDHAVALASVDAALPHVSTRARWLVSMQAASLVWLREGPACAWKRVEATEPVWADDRWREDSPLVSSAVLTYLGLAAALGASQAHERMAKQASAIWPEKHPSAVRVALSAADCATMQGNYSDALRRLKAIKGAAHGDLRLHLLCSQLHALAGAGRGSTRRARRIYRDFRELARTAPMPGSSLSGMERRNLRERAAQIARASGLVSSDGGRPATNLSRLLYRERQARRIKEPTRRVPALLKVLRRAESLLLRSEGRSNPDETLRLKLLWCRIWVDLGQLAMFDTVERMLDQTIASATRLNRKPLQMLALDQRAVLRSRRNPVDWKGAIVDSTHAASLALELIAANVDPSTGKGIGRSLLASLLPVMDRVIDLHAEGALRITQRHPELLASPLGPIEPILEEETPRGSFLRFGRVLHTFTEQAQALALAEARKAFDTVPMNPRRFVVAEPGEPRIVVDALCRKLPSEDAILQYFVVGRYVLVFVYGANFFDWNIAVVSEAEGRTRPEPAHDRLEALLRGLRGWTQGECHEADDAALAELHRLVLPKKIDDALSMAGVRHLRIVPHDVLYRVPFGRIATNRGPLLHRFSMSLHPTGQTAASAVGNRGEAVRTKGPSVLGFVVGPQVECADEEGRAIARGAGRVASLVRVVQVAVAGIRIERFVARTPGLRILHFLCHGDEGGGFGRSPALHLGEGASTRLDLSRATRLPLHQCSLVILQSCWTGWMDHRRTNPVQGFPQAFCDAGACAVIAPLTKIPEALTPLFTEVLYRTLRFLPAERALQRTLELLRSHAAVLVAKSPVAKRLLEEHGSIDMFEYRYTGMTGLTFGGRLSRWIGRLSFWWWERGLLQIKEGSV